MRRNLFIRVLGIVLTLICAVTMLSLTAFAAGPALNKTSIKLTSTGTYTLKVSGTTETVKWSTSDAKVATVSSKGKVTAQSKGACYIYAKVGKTTLKCKVTTIAGAIALEKNTLTLKENGGNAVIKCTVKGLDKAIGIITQNASSALVGVKEVDGTFYITVSPKSAGVSKVTVYLKSDKTIKKTITVNVVTDETAKTDDSEDYKQMTTAEMAKDVADIVNKERATKGLSALTFDNELCQVANLRAEEIATLFSHTRPNGKDCFSAYTELGYTNYEYCTRGENIAAGQKTSVFVMESWMNSSGHCANILGSKYTKIGVGVYYSGNQYYWVQVFSN